MSNPKTIVTPERIARHDWWWRKPQPGVTIDERGRMKGIPGDALGVVWKDGNEGAAFKYELCRRLDRTLPKWIELPRAAVAAVIQALGEKTSIITAAQGGKFAVMLTPRKGGGFDSSAPVQTIGHSIVATPNGQEKPGYTEPIWFNLAATDSALLKCFREFIAEQRRLKKIRPAKLPRKNAISWRRLEVWDLSEIDGIPLNASERSMKSNATDTAKKALPLVLDAIKSTGKAKKNCTA